MSRVDVPLLSHDMRLAISREGGFAYLPGLAAPREIECERLSDDKCARLGAWLSRLANVPEASTTGADRRCFRLTLSSRRTGEACWQRRLDEPCAPAWLVRLWRDGESALDEDDPAT